MELLRRHAFSLKCQINGPNYQTIMKSIDDVLHLSLIFGIQVSEPGLLLVEFVFLVVLQLLDASLEDEGLLELIPEKKSIWPTVTEDMEIDTADNCNKMRNGHHDVLYKGNTTMAIEIIGEFLQDKVTSRILFLAWRNMPSHWEAFIQQLRVLAAKSMSLRNSKHITPETLLQLTSDTHKVLSRECKTISRQEFHAVMGSGSLTSSSGQCHGTSPSTLWLPIDLFLEDAMDGSKVAAAGATETLTGLVKALQAVNGTTWHDTFLGLWIAALRLVQRERDISEGPIPRLDTCLCMLFSITPLVVATIVEEEESELMDESDYNQMDQTKEKQITGRFRKDLISSLQMLTNFEALLTPPQSICSAANKAAAKAIMFVSGLTAGNGYYECMSANDMPMNCSGNLRHLIVEACIARNLLDTSAYLWPGYVNARANIPHSVPSQVPGWLSLMKGSPLTTALINALIATPASSLPEIEKIYEIATKGSNDDKISAASILCGASLLKCWYRQHQECIASTLSGLVQGTTVHQIVDALLNMMFRKIGRGSQSLTSTTSGSSSSSATGAEDILIRLKLPAWDILEGTPYVLDAALTACAHGRIAPRELATGLKDLADFLPATLGTIVSYFSAEVTRGIWKPVFMNGTDWPSPLANLSIVEQQIKKIIAATGVDVPSLETEESSPAMLPLPLAALVSLAITYKLDKTSERFLILIGPALNSLGGGCPWPCMPIISALWAQKVKRWNDFLVFSASCTVFHHNSDAVVQLLRSCFTVTLGLSPSIICSSGGVGAVLGHGFGSHFSGGMAPVAPGIMYLRAHRKVRDIMFMNEEIVSLLISSVRDIARSGLSREKMEKLKKTKFGLRYGQVSLGMAMKRVKLAASLGASLIWLSGGLGLVQSLIKETLPSWFISAHTPNHWEPGGVVSMLCGYALAYFVVLCGTFAWGVDSASSASKRRPKVLAMHLKFLASALDGKISLGCDYATWRAYVTGFLSLLVGCTHKWVLDIDVDVLKRLSNGLRQWNEEELAIALLGLGGADAAGTAAELIIKTGA
ncbi:Mediator of RNA polymerase II transcription subunit 33A [Hibiscus syriacus]|uniref:Mediator of RNA polymerase II transcription subunit 33A n=1 Tax=Hibiscus syriacus TaxID=106335 RepID=A0A6A2WY22_HIBSY|nr:Mediator of RNA polymerase II transcription subunit 33A [Hibiscus syriacus]